MSTKRIKLLLARAWLARLLRVALHPRGIDELGQFREARCKLANCICHAVSALAAQDVRLRDL